MMELDKIYKLVSVATQETCIMVIWSAVISFLLGFPVGVLLCISDPKSGIKPRFILYQILSRIVNILRSFPFLILMICLFPLSRLILHTSIGTKATILSLSIAAAPFVARVIETALKEVDPGVIQAARAMGSTTFQIIYKVLIPEALPALIDGITLTIINLIGYSAMAGAIGGGGLGDLALRFGYQRFRTEIMVIAVIIIIVIVELIQWLGDTLSHHILSKR